MSKWEMVRLGDVCEVITKGTTPTTIGYSFQKKGINFLKIENLAEDGTFLLEKIEHISEECNEKLRRSILKENDILFSIAGALGRTAIVTKEILPANTNQALSIVRLRQAESFPKYIQYVLKSTFVFQQFQKQKQGVAQLNLSLKNISDLIIPLPPIELQKKIARTLDTASELITLRKKQLAELDNLIKSTFYDMFGDPVTNDKGWEVKPLGELSVLITKGSSPTWQGIEYVNDCNQVLFVTSENVKNGYLDFTKEKFLEEKFNEIQARSILKQGDILINIVGASIGRAAIYTLNKTANINQAVALVRLREGINKQYLNFYLNSPKAIMLYTQMQVDVARANLSLKNINDLPILYPLISIQDQFAEIVTKIEEQKALVQKAANESQYLFDSLMSEYFV